MKEIKVFPCGSVHVKCTRVADYIDDLKPFDVMSCPSDYTPHDVERWGKYNPGIRLVMTYSPKYHHWLIYRRSN